MGIEGGETLRETCRQAKEQYDETVLVLQGGGALGAYQAGVYDMLADADFHPTWVAGISIGAINCALIAGNPPERRVAALRAFWDQVTGRVSWPWLPDGDELRSFFNQMSANAALMMGQPGFFTPRFPPPQFQPVGSTAAISYYDTAPLRATLERYCDFELLNSGPVRLSVGAVNIRSGNFVYFDNRQRRIGPEHIMASGALPPGFPPVEVEGELYWDGGMVSNTPLQYVLTEGIGATLIFQVDLFSARGNRPRSIHEVNERAKDIQYSSRTRLNTDLFGAVHRLRRGINHLLEKLPPEALEDPGIKEIAKLTSNKLSLVNIIHFIYRRKQYDREHKDYEFSHNTMVDHWNAGRNDVMRTLRHRDWLQPPSPQAGVATHDIHYDAAD